jgi:serine phosphatase RsbU (regulator of sigma subunit)
MTKAALASLIRAGRTPGDVLGRLDRVLRELYGPRFFTALALVRLDPSTGAALYANAGFPYPFAIVGGDAADAADAADSSDAAGSGGGRVVELEQPGLPVGGGPARSYQDLELVVEPGGALVFCSDGLFEALGSPETAERGAPDRPYGFLRPRRVLEASRRSSAPGLLEEILTDWHRFVRRERPEDDTTVLVVRRDDRAAA